MRLLRILFAVILAGVQVSSPSVVNFKKAKVAGGPGPNLLTNPSTINVAPWEIFGTGASLTGATTFVSGSSGTSVYQDDVPVTASTSYVVSATLSKTGAAVFGDVFIGGNGGSGYIDGCRISVTTTPTLCSKTVNSGANTVLRFEITTDAATSVTWTVTGSSLRTP